MATLKSRHTLKKPLGINPLERYKRTKQIQHSPRSPQSPVDIKKQSKWDIDLARLDKSWDAACLLSKIPAAYRNLECRTELKRLNESILEQEIEMGFRKR
jgi:hypothetical protein